MSVHEQSIQYSDKGKIRWWYWPVLILGSVMVVGGIVGVIILQKGGQYARYTFNRWYYPLDFVAAGSTSQLPSRPDPLDYTCDWNHLVDYLVGAASENQKVKALDLKAKPIYRRNEG